MPSQTRETRRRDYHHHRGHPVHLARMRPTHIDLPSRTYPNKIHATYSHHARLDGNPMSIRYLLNPASSTASLSPLPTPSTSPSPSPSPSASPAESLLRQKRKMQSEKKRQWRKNLTPEQKERRQMLDAQRKREQRMNQTDEQRAEARRKDAARKAAKRRLLKQQAEHHRRHLSHLSSDAISHRHVVSTSTPRRGRYHGTDSMTGNLRHSIDKILNSSSQ